MTVEVVHGDCRVVLAGFLPNSVDTIITDPPYELGFMGKKWDSSGIAYDVALWREVLRVAKPGAFLAAFGGTRTYHRMACAIEDAGWELRDSLAWIYGSGMPKSHDVSKAIDKHLGAERPVVGSWKPTGTARVKGGQGAATAGKGSAGHGGELRDTLPITAPGSPEAAQWEGWGTALKPSIEPIVLARKPLMGTVAANMLEHGTGGIHVDACRMPLESGVDTSAMQRQGSNRVTWEGGESSGFASDHVQPTYDTRGRWPANTLLSHDHDEDEPCADGCPVAAIDAQSGVTKSHSPGLNAGVPGKVSKSVAMGDRRAMFKIESFHGDTGGASRFFPVFYSAKASRKDRGEGNTHPTVKPLAVMRWLVRLLTPSGGIVLDHFAGSGTTLVACREEGMECLGIELMPEHVEIINRRLA